MALCYYIIRRPLPSVGRAGLGNECRAAKQRETIAGHEPTSDGQTSDEQTSKHANEKTSKRTGSRQLESAEAYGLQVCRCTSQATILVTYPSPCIPRPR